MGELAQRRHARDLHVSRGHLVAATVGLAVWTAIWFTGGFVVGSRSQAPVEVPGTQPLPAAQLQDDALLELLARVEASAVPDGVEELSTRYGQRGVGPAMSAPAVPALPSVSGDPSPPGAFTLDLGRYDDPTAREIQAALRDRGLHTWRMPVVEGGRVTVRLSLGGFPTERAAADELARVEPILHTAGVRAGEVSPVRPSSP